MTTVPGTPHAGPLPPLTAEERDLAARLMRHIEAIGAKPHNIAHPDALENAARYIETTLEALGYAVNRQSFTVGKATVRNIDAVLAGANPQAATLVVGAHYDSCKDAPGANDNASGTAGVLELARLLKDLDGKAGKRIRLALFVNEEPPYFMTDDMGSVRYAKELAARGEKVAGMYSLETIGFYSSEPGSQKYPPPFGLIFGDRGDFIAFVAMSGSRGLLDRTIASFRSHTAFPTVGGAAPWFIPGISWSDHWSFEQYGFEALMVTDTAPFRYPHYHETTDTPDKIDAERMARVVKGMERVVREAAR
jgi:Zn-dependent M28 family amino/carboxypeptidase